MEKVEMVNRARRISFYLIGVIVSIVGAIIVSCNVSAVDTPKCDGKSSDSFKICVGGSYVTYDPMDPMGTEYPGGSISSTETVKSDGNGNYSVEGQFNTPNVSLEVNDRELWVYIGKGCYPRDEDAVKAKVPFKDNINDFKNAIQSAIGGKEWEFICDGPNMDTKYKVAFSSSDIYDESQTELPSVPSSNGTASGGDNSISQTNCMNSGGLNTLGWVLCPALELMSNSSRWLYDEAIEPALKVEPKLFNQSDGTINGWEIFRNIANGFFTILLLVVVFSQLTGVGIDNYGIKRILPKLIVAAILMNLSYWICLVFVDLSNIVGNSLQRLFTDLGNGLPAPPSSIGDVSLSSLGSTLSTSVALLVALYAGVWAAGGGVGVALMLLVAAISIIVALFFLFILLAAREAVVVVLLVISPLAFACYILPNTKSLFDKWWKLGSALLLVYPICGLLVGGGDFVSKLLLSIGGGADGFFMAFVAMVAGIAPIFFIPTVLKNSFAAMGNLGAKISGIGRNVGGRLSGAADRGIRGSERFQNHQALNERRQKMRGAQRIVDRYGNRDRAYLSDSQRRRLTEAEKTIGAYQMQAAAEREGAFIPSEEVAQRRARSAKEAQEYKAYQEQFSRFDRNGLLAEANSASSWLRQPGGEMRMSALIGAMEANGMENDIYEMLKKNGNIGSMSSVMQTLAGSNNKVLKAYGKRGNGVSYGDFMNGFDANGNSVSSLQDYIREKGPDYINGLDDKALGEIARYNNGQALSTGQLVQAAAQLNSEDSIGEVNKMLRERTDITGNISGEQLVNFNDTTVEELVKMSREGEVDLSGAIEAVKSDPQLLSRMSDARKNQLGITSPSSVNGQNGQVAADVARRTQQSQQDQLGQDLQNVDDVQSNSGGATTNEDGSMSIGHGDNNI